MGVDAEAACFAAAAEILRAGMPALLGIPLKPNS